MTPYDSPAAFRQAIDDRLRQEAADRHVDTQRLRRGLVFERIMVRLSVAEPRYWIVKGGMALEWRVRERARATRDLDLVVRAEATSERQLRERLVEALAADPDGDWFTFGVADGEPLTPDAAGRPGHRFPVRADLAGREFASVRLDIVARGHELYATADLLLPASLSFRGIPPRTIVAVAPQQHFAEKLHALTRDYGDRPSGRVHDLVDLVLLIEENLVTPGEALAASRHVFDARRTHSLPLVIPDPPVSWREDYPARAGSAAVRARDVDDALRVLRQFWAKAMREDMETK